MVSTHHLKTIITKFSNHLQTSWTRPKDLNTISPVCTSSYTVSLSSTPKPDGTRKQNRSISARGALKQWMDQSQHVPTQRCAQFLFKTGAFQPEVCSALIENSYTELYAVQTPTVARINIHTCVCVCVCVCVCERMREREREKERER